MTSYPFHGGPLGGSQSDEAATIYTYQNGVMAALQCTAGVGEDAPPFVYGLVEQNGRKAFVPVRDRDLVDSYQQSEGRLGGLEVEALKDEIHRRNIVL